MTLPFTVALVLLPGALSDSHQDTALFLICSVGVVALYADDIRVSRLRRHGLEAPNDRDLGQALALREAGLGAIRVNSISLRAASVMLPDGRVDGERGRQLLGGEALLHGDRDGEDQLAGPRVPALPPPICYHDGQPSQGPTNSVVKGSISA